ncbi:MAG TPA: nickel pincer cofactor biosynthesis protein LarC [Ardenticatenaceae bacterium]|nr:nickel pincer cofactor biosynthesis protein LarC [Ardenticatenaceae bacterium]
MLAYLDTPSGISGDMFLGCLLDAGWTEQALRATTAAVLAAHTAPSDWAIEARHVRRGALRATLVDVRVDEERQPHRHLADVNAIIAAAALPAQVKQHALAIFAALGRAEAHVHGIGVEEVHFHEVGALDAIVDVVGVCTGLHELGITALYAAPLPLGSGWTDSHHGQIPLPAPATLELLAAAGAPTRPAPGPGELVTPTGAALVAHFALGRWQQPAMRLRRIGIGGGQRDLAWPNVARLWLGDALDDGDMIQLETNTDDMNPEFVAAVSEKLFAAGAADVWVTPVQMKKNRPGIMLTVLARRALETTLAEIILRETTTLGLRVQPVGRHEAEREMRSVETIYGVVPVKLKVIGGQILGAVPEYEACKRAADAAGVPVRLVYEAAQAAGHTCFVA